MAFFRVLGGAAVSLALVCGQALAADVVREGDGPRRAELDAMERQPVDPRTWEYLTGWTGKAPLTEADMAGKVVLVCTWAKWYPQSMRAMPILEEMTGEYTEDDLIVVAVHHPRSFDAADAATRAETLKIRVAHDADGKFREALKVDQDPDFFVIDRAGQMRYADIANASVRDAVDELVAESREEATSLNDRLAQAAADRESEFRRTDSINQEVDLRNIPEVTFMAPDPSEYANAAWPRLPRDPNSGSMNQEPTPVAYPLASLATVQPPTLPSPQGRAAVIYFWHPNYPSTYERVVGEMDLLQKSKGRDLIVVGMITPFSSNNYGQQTDENDPVRLTRIFTDMIRNKRLVHWMGLDLSGAGLGALRGNQYNSGSDRQGAYCAIVSSDGLVRWHGNPLSGTFEAALEKVLSADPGIRERRAAEAEYIRTRSK